MSVSGFEEEVAEEEPGPAPELGATGGLDVV
jgi:hypothetical protein